MTVDTSAAPVGAELAFTIEDPESGTTVAADRVHVRGTCSEGVTEITRTVEFGFDDHAACVLGAWAMEVGLEEGQNELNFRIGDDDATARVLTVTYAPSAAAPSEAPATVVPESEAPAPAVVATPAPKPAKFSGKTSKNTKAFTLHAPARFDLSYSGRGNFIVTLMDTTNKDQLALLVNDIGKTKVRTYVYGYDGTRVYLDVIASGSWKVTVTPTSPTPKELPVTFKGTTGLVTVPVVIAGDATVKYSHKGEGNFIVTLYDLATGSSEELLVNEIGSLKGETELYGLAGVYVLDVVADGKWSVSISQ
jgi:hypothetical protein